MQLLYKSEQVHSAIKALLSAPDPADRRVVLVAFVGGDARYYLPSPKGLRLICDPAPGSTDPDALRSLIRRGAAVEFSYGLHMKVYWSELRGCVITSANLSSSALGRRGLREAGVLLGPGKVDIDRLIAEADPKEPTQNEFDKLDRAPATTGIRFSMAKRGKRRMAAYADWYRAPWRKQWKLGWWEVGEIECSKEGRTIAQREFDLREPDDLLNVKRNQVLPGDWLLTFDCSTRRIKSINWMYVDRAVVVRPNERGAYEKEYPFQAIQMHPLSKYPDPPFELSNGFRQGFRAAVARYGIERIKNAKSLIPSANLLQAILEQQGSQPSSSS